MKRSTKVGLGLFAVIGAFFVGWLTAPKSGKETREDIRRTANKARAQLESKLKKTHSELRLKIDEVTEAVKGKRDAASKKARTSLAEAREARDRLRTLLSSVRDGESDDDEVNEAVASAKASLKSLKGYLKGDKA